MESESSNRKQRIDPRLKAAGWSIGSFDPTYAASPPKNTAVEEWPTTAGPADYALCETGLVLGVVEAKKLTIGAQGVLPQAERYSRAIKIDIAFPGGFGVPFLYSTNGEEIWFHDVRQPLNRSRRISAFHTPTALREQMDRDFEAELAALRAIPLHEGIRPYQVEANTAIEQAIADRQRKMLVTMATGTGKTLMTVNEIYRLMKSGVARRVLFLVDRRALAAQTVRAFASFEAEPGLKFDKIYPVYSQRFQQGDFGKDEKFDPNVMPNSLLTEPEAGRCLRLRLHHSAHEHQPVRPRAGISAGDGETRKRMPKAEHSDPCLRSDRRRRVPSRILGEGTVGVAQHARLVRRDQNRTDRHACSAHHGLLREAGVPLRLRAGGPRGVPGRLQRGPNQQRRARERRIPQRRRAGRPRRPGHRGSSARLTGG